MIPRGAIYEIKAAPKALGREQQGGRCAVIIQSDQFATGVLTVAMTSTRAAQTIYRPLIDLAGTKTRILTDQIHSVDPDRLGTFTGVLEAAEMERLNQALLLKLGLF